MNNGISVDIVLIPRKNRSNNNKYDIYLAFYVYQNSMKQGNPEISTGISVEIDQWDRDRVKGRNDKAKLINEKLDSYMTSAQDMINELFLKKAKTCKEVITEIKANAKPRITGKASKGGKNDIISKLKDYSYENIMNRLFEDKAISTGRRRGYKRSFNLLEEYFNNKIPTIDQISSEDLEGFKKWYLKGYDSKQNTAADYFSKIAAVIKYALKLKVIVVNPLPERFRLGFVDGNKESLTEEERFQIINLDDNSLSRTEQVAKYCLLVQLLTGMGYSDMKALTYNNIKFDTNERSHYIEKLRNKTGIPFKVFLTANAFYMVEKLKSLTQTVDKPFNLPSIDYSLRMYKEIGKKAEVKTNITTYTLRHTFAVDYMENDGRLEDLQKFLGHTNLKTTQIYGKISNKRLSTKTKELQGKSKMHQLQPLMKAV